MRLWRGGSGASERQCPRWFRGVVEKPATAPTRPISASRAISCPRFSASGQAGPRRRQRVQLTDAMAGYRQSALPAVENRLRARFELRRQVVVSGRQYRGGLSRPDNAGRAESHPQGPGVTIQGVSGEKSRRRGLALRWRPAFSNDPATSTILISPHPAPEPARSFGNARVTREQRLRSIQPPGFRLDDGNHFS